MSGTDAGTTPGALIGFCLGLGSAMVFWRLPCWRRPTLEDRLRPYLRLSAPTSGLLTRSTPLTALERVFLPLARDAATRLERVLGGSGGVLARLDQAGNRTSLETFRAEQVLCGVGGGLLGMLVGGLLATAHGNGLLLVLVLLVVGALGGVSGRDSWLSVQVSRRNDRILAEFPVVAELLALSVGAGEGAAGALERVARVCRGELTVELERALAEARVGMPLEDALDTVARRTGLPALERFVDGITVAVQRGTPLAEVLRAQAADVRELSRRRLMEAGGKKEIAMMVPVVFLILPITVVFAVYPGLAVLQLDL